jgi:hypothetical protein
MSRVWEAEVREKDDSAGKHGCGCSEKRVEWWWRKRSTGTVRLSGF